MAALTGENGPYATALGGSILILKRITHAIGGVFAIAVYAVAAPAGEAAFNTGEGELVLHAQQVWQLLIIQLGQSL